MMIKNPAIALALSMTGCSALNQATETSPMPDCIGAEITLADIDDSTGCDLNPPQQLNAYISIDTPYTERCNDAGGSIIWIDSMNRTALCIDLDY